MSYKVFIIDDEPDSLSLLQLQLNKHCPEIDAITCYSSAVKALEDIKEIKPDLVFLDVEMPKMDGFEFLEKVIPLSFKVIFVTAYSHYAIRALKFSALDYLIKPVDHHELKLAVNKALSCAMPQNDQFHILQSAYSGKQVHKLAIHSQSEIVFIDIADIVLLEASNNYTRIIFKSKPVMVISRLLKEVQLILEEIHFLRVHRQYIVNLNQVISFNKSEQTLVMSNNMQLPLAKNLRERFMERYIGI